MGHTHVPLYREYARDKVYVETRTWNPMTSLDMGSRLVACLSSHGRGRRWQAEPPLRLLPARTPIRMAP